VRVKGDRLLKTGQEYLFATSRDPEKCWYTMVAQPFSNIPIGDEEQRAELEERFEKADEEQFRSILRAPLGNLMSEALSPS
jgi:hypothetical protein